MLDKTSVSQHHRLSTVRFKPLSIMPGCVGVFGHPWIMTQPARTTHLFNILHSTRALLNSPQKPQPLAIINRKGLDAAPTPKTTPETPFSHEVLWLLHLNLTGYLDE